MSYLTLTAKSTLIKCLYCLVHRLDYSSVLSKWVLSKLANLFIGKDSLLIDKVPLLRLISKISEFCFLQYPNLHHCTGQVSQQSDCTIVHHTSICQLLSVQELTHKTRKNYVSTKIKQWPKVAIAPNDYIVPTFCAAMHTCMRSRT